MECTKQNRPTRLARNEAETNCDNFTTQEQVKNFVDSSKNNKLGDPPTSLLVPNLSANCPLYVSFIIIFSWQDVGGLTGMIHGIVNIAAAVGITLHNVRCF